jgi:multidrug transporter EmrE-like cation transporter
MPFSSLLLVILAGVNSCIGNILLKMSSVKLVPGASLIERAMSPYFIGGLVFYAVNVVVFAKALDQAPVSVAYPVLAVTGFALLALTSSFLFGERLAISQWIGLAFAVIGIFLLARPG